MTFQRLHFPMAMSTLADKNFLDFILDFWEFWQNHMLALGAQPLPPLPRGTDPQGESWICPWIHVQTFCAVARFELGKITGCPFLSDLYLKKSKKYSDVKNNPQN